MACQILRKTFRANWCGQLFDFAIRDNNPPTVSFFNSIFLLNVWNAILHKSLPQIFELGLRYQDIANNWSKITFSGIFQEFLTSIVDFLATIQIKRNLRQTFIREWPLDRISRVLEKLSQLEGGYYPPNLPDSSKNCFGENCI